jgi:hypothetical protein
MPMAYGMDRNCVNSIMSERQSVHGADGMDQILCPACGKQIATVSRLKEIVSYCKIFWGQCDCGLKYRAELSFFNGLVLSFPEKHTVEAR